MYKSYYPKESEIERKWFVADANQQNLGRFAARVARVLLGKHKPGGFTPGVEMGDYVVVVNAEHVTATGTKTSLKMDSKMYHHHSGYPGGLKSVSMTRTVAYSSRPRITRSRMGHAAAQQDGPFVDETLEDLRRPKSSDGLQKPEPLK